MKNKVIPFHFFALILFVIFIVYSFVRLEDNVYYWDYKGYWFYWQQFIDDVTVDPFDALMSLKHSVRHDDYNILPVVLVSIFGALPLTSRLAYILSIALVYLVPTIILFTFVFSKALSQSSKLRTYFIFCVSATFIPFWGPVLSGYPDICGLIFILLALAICLDIDLRKSKNIKFALLLGFFLWMPFLLRRWYAYTIVSLYLSLPVLIFSLRFSKKNTREHFLNIIVFFLIAGTTTCFLAMVCQWPLIRRIITTDYSFIYSAYQSSFLASVVSLIHTVGIYFSVFFVAGICFLFKCGFRQRVFFIFCLFNLLFSFFLFTRTQSPGIQHMLPFALWILFISLSGIFFLADLIRSNSARVSFFLLLVIFSVFVQYSSLFNKKNDFISFYLPRKTTPLQVYSINEYRALVNKLDLLTRSGEHVSILSSNNILNDDMVNTLSEGRLNKKLVYASQVDLRDEINILALMSNYIVVTDPVQLHLKPEGQRVISIPVESILTGHDIGQAFNKIASFRLTDKVSAIIYERNRNFNRDEVTSFLNKFYEHYPQWESKYNGGFFIPYMTAKITLGDIYGAFDLSSDDTIFAHPGETSPTKVSWIFPDTDILKIASTNMQCNTDDTIIITIRNSESENVLHIKKGDEISVDISKFKAKEGSLYISKNKSSGCDAIKIRL